MAPRRDRDLDCRTANVYVAGGRQQGRNAGRPRSTQARQSRGAETLKEIASEAGLYSHRCCHRQTRILLCSPSDHWFLRSPRARATIQQPSREFASAFDDVSTKCRASNRPSQLSASFLFTPPSTTHLIFNDTCSAVRRFDSFEARPIEFGTTRRLLRPE